MLCYQLNILTANILGVIIFLPLGQLAINRFYKKHHERMGGGDNMEERKDGT